MCCVLPSGDMVVSASVQFLDPLSHWGVGKRWYFNSIISLKTIGLNNLMIFPFTYCLVILWCTSCRKGKKNFFSFLFFFFLVSKINNQFSIIYQWLATFKKCHYTLLKLKIVDQVFIQHFNNYPPQSSNYSLLGQWKFFNVASESFSMAHKLDGFLTF